ncbi:MAG TPA: GlsB/YeaQ/YmgE family stress response membrane protein [Polyangia bacterium]
MLGIVGAFLGGLIFRALHLGTPFRGVASTIFVAFVGSVVLLLLMRLVSRTTARGR